MWPISNGSRANETARRLCGAGRADHRVLRVLHLGEQPLEPYEHRGLALFLSMSLVGDEDQALVRFTRELAASGRAYW